MLTVGLVSIFKSKSNLPWPSFIDLAFKTSASIIIIVVIIVVRGGGTIARPNYCYVLIMLLPLGSNAYTVCGSTK